MPATVRRRILLAWIRVYPWSRAAQMPARNAVPSFTRGNSVNAAMNSRRSGISIRMPVFVLVLSFLFTPTLQAQQPSRDQRIEEMQKQIEALKKRLEEVKSSTGKSATAAAAAIEGALPESWVKALTWRSIGPAAMGGRITAISVFGPDPSIYFVATASGGLLKTNNNGVTFDHQFDHEATVSIGDVCVSPSNADIVWVGTGEANPRNSASFGDGVYKSTDGGKTWKNMGLKKSYRLARSDPRPTLTSFTLAPWVALGPTKSGLFKTTDGGKTWNKILYFDTPASSTCACILRSNLLVAMATDPESTPPRPAA